MGPAQTTFSAVGAGAGADVDQVIRCADAIFIVLDHDDRVADVSQPLERADEPRVVALMQADGRLVQHIADADQTAAHLRRQANALRLAAGEACRSCDPASDIPGRHPA